MERLRAEGHGFDRGCKSEEISRVRREARCSDSSDSEVTAFCGLLETGGEEEGSSWVCDESDLAGRCSE